jgi:hypothetical protein
MEVGTKGQKERWKLKKKVDQSLNLNTEKEK